MGEQRHQPAFSIIKIILSKICRRMRIISIREKVVVNSENHGKQFCGADEEAE